MTSAAQLVRSSKVPLLIQIEPPIQPATLGGANSSWPWASHAADNASGLIADRGTSSVRSRPALNSTGDFSALAIGRA